MDYLPIFVNVKNQHCLIIGGGEVAARKADLFIKSGAIVTVISPKLKTEMKRHLSLGKITWHPQKFSTQEMTRLKNKNKPKYVISATDETAVNQAVYHYCQTAEIPVNVADQTEYCDFILPAIIERSPITIAVSTGGRSPVLARLMKAKLEALIPAGFGRLADILGRYRNQVKQTITGTEKRKVFWETLLQSSFVDKATQGRAEEAEKILQEQIAKIAKTGQALPTGEVYLIGAGPGDPDLMTFKGLRLLQQADVVLYDRLVAPEIVEMARREAERIYVGKKDKHHAIPQKDISQLMVKLAKQGKRVARLKGGDPYIFGRGAEEAEILAKNNIVFEVVPGITAAAGCSAYAGFPLTHREFSQSVSLITGHQQEGESEIDYARLANNSDTMVFYMGIKNSAKIQTGLLQQGMSKSLPVAIIEKGTTPQQRTFITTLEKLTDTIEKNLIKPPAIFIIGNVVKIRERLIKT